MATKQKTKFKQAVKKAKHLYKSGRYQTFGDAVKAAYKGKGIGRVSSKDSSTGAGHTSTSTRATTTGNRTGTKTITAHVKIGSKKRVGATKFIERGESRNTKPKRVVRVNRSKKGTYKKFSTVGNVKSSADYNYVILQRLNSTNVSLKSAESQLHYLKAALRTLSKGMSKNLMKRRIRDQQRLVSTVKKEIRMLKVLLK